MNTANQVCHSDANKSLDNVSSLSYIPRMPDLGHILSMMRKRHEYEMAAFDKAQESRTQLADAYSRYMELTAEIRQREDTLEKLTLALETRGEKLELLDAIQLYLQFDSPVQVAEILHFLEWIRRSSTRQAVEATIRRHPKIFAVKKRGREKFISLK